MVRGVNALRSLPTESLHVSHVIMNTKDALPCDNAKESPVMPCCGRCAVFGLCSRVMIIKLAWPMMKQVARSLGATILSRGFWSMVSRCGAREMTLHGSFTYIPAVVVVFVIVENERRGASISST